MSDDPQPQPPLIFLIKTLYQGLHASMDRSLQEVGVTIAQLAVLMTLHRMPNPSNADLARAALMTPQSMGQLVAALERDGLLQRHPDPRHARIQRTTLTAEGERVLKAGIAITSRVEAELSCALTSVELTTIRHLLTQLMAAMDN
jgi:DNA-binding MarR family transcriptional regulator